MAESLLDKSHSILSPGIPTPVAVGQNELLVVPGYALLDNGGVSNVSNGGCFGRGHCLRGES
jgi:hypothetical protein